MRKIIQASSFGEENTDILALADDGTLWIGLPRLSDELNEAASTLACEWLQVPSLPSDKHHFVNEQNPTTKE